MALKAGYQGIKKNSLSTLEALAGLGIKSLGSMFKLSSAGELSVREATATLPGIIKLNDIPSGGADYSLTEKDTGEKWIDDKNIYKRVYALGSGVNVCLNAVITQYVDNKADIDTIIEAWAISNRNGQACIPCIGSITTNDVVGLEAPMIKNAVSSAIDTYTALYAVLFYTKN